MMQGYECRSRACQGYGAVKVNMCNQPSPEGNENTGQESKQACGGTRH